jgi:hypothetical protein
VAVDDVAEVPGALGTSGLGEVQSAATVTTEEAQVVPLPAMLRCWWWAVRATAPPVMPAMAVRTQAAMTHFLGIMPDHLPLSAPRDRGGEDHL